MPSPFAGMDPYLETPEAWRDFHNNLASEIQGRLNERLDPRYDAALEAHVTYETVEVASPRRAHLDVSVWGEARGSTGSPAGIAIAPAPVESQVPLDEPLQLFTVEVRRSTSHALVTSIERLSPVNKTPGHEAFAVYRRKRRALLSSDAHVMEIDLLRGGERPPLVEPVPPAAYYVILSRAERRPICEVWPITLRDLLPVLPVPLIRPDPDIPLDLGASVASVYEHGAYARRLDYGRQVPPPALSPEDEAWVSALLERAHR